MKNLLKNNWYLLPLCLHAFTTHGQSLSYPRINFDISAFRYGAEKGLDHTRTYAGIFHVMSAVKLGVAIREGQVIHAGLRRQPDQYTTESSGIITENISSKGFEAMVGYEQQIRIVPFFSLLAEIGLFYDRAYMTGGTYKTSWTGEQIRHCRVFKGVYPELKVAFHLSKHIALLAGARLRAGYVSNSKNNYTTSLRPDYTATEGYAVSSEPLSTLAFRYQL